MIKLLLEKLRFGLNKPLWPFRHYKVLVEDSSVPPVYLKLRRNAKRLDGEVLVATQGGIMQAMKSSIYRFGLRLSSGIGRSPDFDMKLWILNIAE